MKHFPFQKRAVAIATALLFTAPLGTAQDATTAPPPPPPVDPLLQLLEEVRTQRQVESVANQQRIREFEQARERQRELLEQAKADLQAARDRSDQLRDDYQTNEETLKTLETQLQEELGDLGEIFGNVRQIAGELKAIFENSIVSAQIPGRTAFVSEVAESKALPKIEQIERLWYELQRETTEAGRVVQFTAPVLTAGGEEVERTVTRISVFNALSEGKFLRYFVDTQQLNELPRQPSDLYTEPALKLEAARTGFVNTWVDPSQGMLLQAFSQSPDVTERVRQGREVGLVILGLLAVGLILCLERFIYLYYAGLRMRSQLKNPDEVKNNPLGRIIETFKRYSGQGTDLETLELKLDEAIMKETPPFERGLSTIKILAAVAPLLGLLGTVTGMIETFQSITLFGTGDPKLMAGGISQALVTTVLGLVAAIPLVLLHSILQGKSEQQIQLLEEQSAGLVAEYAEQRNQTESSES